MSRQKLLEFAFPAFALAMALAAWEAAVRWFAIPPFILPAPSLIATTLIKDWGTLSRSLMVTLTITLEALAPLVGVSRRSLHHWIAGHPISQRNEERLRALAEAIEQIATAAPGSCRDRLMERVSGSPRVFDLLAEGRYEAAVARVTGASPAPRPLVYPAAKPPTTPLLAQLNVSEERSLPLNGQIDRRFTKPIKLKR